MPQLYQEHIVSYSAAQMYALVMDFEHYPHFLPWCQSCTVVSRQNDRIVAQMRVGFHSLHDTFETEVLGTKCTEINVNYVSGPLKYLTTRWGFEDIGDKKCKVIFDLSFDLKSKILGFMLDVVLESAFRKMVSSFEERAKSLYV